MINFKKDYSSHHSTFPDGFERYYYNHYARVSYIIYLNKTTNLVDLTKFSNAGGFVYTQDRGWRGISTQDSQMFLTWNEAVSIITLDIL